MDDADSDEISKMADGLFRLVARRDPEAANHLEVTGDLAERIAREMLLAPHVVFRTALAGRLHDLGMLAIPATITKKSAEPDRLERRELQMHPIYGASILDGIARLRPIAEIVRAHHERPDGKGYPNGLPEYDIPIEAKIIAVAEAFHAMTSERVFAVARTENRAMAEIYRCRGTQFDPDVVDAFCRVMRWEPGMSSPTRLGDAASA
jgi:HD-GYP domain-containing protein (c-di-GMP phosphodiesterase class II)